MSSNRTSRRVNWSTYLENLDHTLEVASDDQSGVRKIPKCWNGKSSFAGHGVSHKELDKEKKPIQSG